MLTEQDVLIQAEDAVRNGEFIPYYQPKYNHATGMLIGAEALARWMHPTEGTVSPAVFIPAMEKGGRITELDLCIFEQVCQFLHKCRENRYHLAPISVNITRDDIRSEGFVERVEEIRARYEVPSRYLRFEITETLAMENVEQANKTIDRLHQLGYTIELDDFGSGYSSLNTLKDLNIDGIKLDVNFLRGEVGGRGGIIISSVVRMARWLGLPIIAEGVETVEQADYMRSIGCDDVQGYLYHRPMPEEAYRKLLSGAFVGVVMRQTSYVEHFDSLNFWDPRSLETLIFSNFVGGAAIFEYYRGRVELLRVNRKYLSELGMNMTERDIFLKSDFFESFDAEGRVLYLNAIREAAEYGEEQEVETWRSITSSCCGNELLCIRTSLRVIGKTGERCLFYAMIRNITTEKRYLEDMRDTERRFRMASEQVNIYFWEYNIATREMRPCFRCMRDLGLPALVTNYPEPAIEKGIFPPEVADLYRDWHRQLEAGAESLAGIFPLTEDRVPFRVTYTTEFNENGVPVKAYGSAALVQD